MLSYIQELRIIRKAVIEFKEIPDHRKYADGFLFSYVLNLYDSVCEKENITNIHKIIERILHYHLMHDPSEAVSDAKEIYNLTIKNDTLEHKIERQKAILNRSIDNMLEIAGCIPHYSQYINEDAIIATLIDDAKIIVDEYEKTCELTDKGILVDVSEDENFYEVVSEAITYDLAIAYAKLEERDVLKKQSALNAANARHASLNKWKEDAKEAARSLWRNSSDFLHNKMVAHLMTMDRFKTTPGGDYPKDILLRVLSKVTDEPEFKERNLKFGSINKK